MIRRQFIKLATLTGATGLASFTTVDALKAAETKTVKWQIHGFTCVTCAVGLDVMLRQQKGVISSHSDYQATNVTIRFDPLLVNESSLRSFITEIGFTTDEQKG